MSYYGYSVMSWVKNPDTLKKKRNRRKKVQKLCTDNHMSLNTESLTQEKNLNKHTTVDQTADGTCIVTSAIKEIETMANDSVESREQVKAAREAKKLAKQQAKLKKDLTFEAKPPAEAPAESSRNNVSKETSKDTKSKDEVDRASAPVERLQNTEDKEQIKAERAAKKVAKQAKKKDAEIPQVLGPVKTDPDMTVRDVIETLRDIKNVAQEIKDVTAQVQALNLDKKKPEQKVAPAKETFKVLQSETKLESSDKPPEGGKSKAELKAERRAKQEAQRAAKEAANQAKPAVKPKEENTQPKEVPKTVVIKEKSPRPKSSSKQGTKQQGHRVHWFRHLYNNDKSKLDKIPINSNLHPAIIKLGVQLATRVVTGSNARCIALLDALKKMVRDYSLPAKTEFGRGLDAHLATSLEFLWGMRQPTASQTNAVKFFRHHLTQLPNNVDEFDAKKTLQGEIDRYIREQIDMAGEAISIAVRKKICNGDNILTYGCSSLIERILVEAHEAGVEFRAVVCGGEVTSRDAREMVRRLTARRVPTVCVDITALSFVMSTQVDKVLLGADSLLGDGSVVGAAGTAAVALAARAHNRPVLVACETHKFSDRVQTDAFLYNEIGDPDELIYKSDDNSPLKDWRSNANLTPLNLTYDVTPPSLVTAVVTELAILPCTSAPVVLRFKLSEYSV